MKTKNVNSLIIAKVQSGSKILELGASYGILTKFLYEEKNCAVDIVEIDRDAGEVAAEYARNSFYGEEQGDIEKEYWSRQLKDELYDYIIIADVLEHLYEPANVLDKVAELLKPEGKVLVSIPNIAHNSILANLYYDSFNYTSLGILGT